MDSITTYLEHIKALRKPKTFQRYQNALNHLWQFLEEKSKATQIVRRLSKAHFSDYQAWRRTTLITPNGREKMSK